MLPILPINSNNTTLPIPGTDRDDLLKFQEQTEMTYSNSRNK